ncbi:metaxin [Schizosaccharomyces japonicus yFS275]|uniref:Metaxin n=1 Tax=Schizosaccharomyces japonicus (strain yFS275 / FY16936) TaxID=402676 RepID=B6K288_SCHJY|nr:metaxin [Schizosaccharomyces japonicus yFS275]EEB07269.1 metaxin [Schizosaccharomyces japonicus yFS275]
MIQLFVYGPGFGRPSIDPACLTALTYCVLAIPADELLVYRTNNSRMSPTQELPALMDGNVWLGGWRSILAYVKQKGYNLDEKLSPADTNTAAVIGRLIERKGNDLWLLDAYCIEENYVKSTRPEWSKVLGFPFNYIKPKHDQQQAWKRLRASWGSDVSDVEYVPSNMPISRMWENERRKQQASLKACARDIRIHSIALSFYKTIEQLFSLNEDGQQGDYIFGDEPSSLDCVLYGYLSLHVYAWEQFPHAVATPALAAESPKLLELLNRLHNIWAGDDNSILRLFPVQTQPQGFTDLATIAWNNVRSKVSESALHISKNMKNQDKLLAYARNGFFITASVFGFVWYVVSNGIVQFTDEDEYENLQTGEEMVSEEPASKAPAAGTEAKTDAKEGVDASNSENGPASAEDETIPSAQSLLGTLGSVLAGHSEDEEEEENEAEAFEDENSGVIDEDDFDE